MQCQRTGRVDFFPYQIEIWSEIRSKPKCSDRTIFEKTVERKKHNIPNRFPNGVDEILNVKKKINSCYCICLSGESGIFIPFLIGSRAGTRVDGLNYFWNFFRHLSRRVRDKYRNRTTTPLKRQSRDAAHALFTEIFNVTWREDRHGNETPWVIDIDRSSPIIRAGRALIYYETGVLSFVVINKFTGFRKTVWSR